MKHLFILAFTLFALSTAAQAAEQQACDVQMDTVHVNGLVCDFCARSLEKVFGEEAAVDGVHVDLTSKEVHISYKPGQILPEEQVRHLINDSGYDVKEVARECMS